MNLPFTKSTLAHVTALWKNLHGCVMLPLYKLNVFNFTVNGPVPLAGMFSRLDGGSVLEEQLGDGGAAVGAGEMQWRRDEFVSLNG